MTTVLARWFAVGAAVLGGLLAGMASDRVVVQLPAWQQLGAIPWAIFTRQADLGRGLLFYPGIGLGALVCSVLAAVFLILDRSPGGPRLPAGAAAVFAIAALIVTRWGIVPHVLSLRATDGNGSALVAAFHAQQRWWTLKAALHVATFLANVWTLVRLRNT